MVNDVKLIGLCGFKGSGKSTAAEYLEQRDYRTIALASPLKKACQIIFHLSDSQVYDSEGKKKVDPRWGMTPREILQLFGTEVGRTFSSDVWIKSLTEYIDKKDHDKWVIDDVRFPNEADFIRDVGGRVIGINRKEVVPSTTWKDYIPSSVASILDIDQIHDSERKMLDNWEEMIDVEIRNDTSLSYLKNEILQLSDEYEGAKRVT